MEQVYRSCSFWGNAAGMPAALPFKYTGMQGEDHGKICSKKNRSGIYDGLYYTFINIYSGKASSV